MEGGAAAGPQVKRVPRLALGEPGETEHRLKKAVSAARLPVLADVLSAQRMSLKCRSDQVLNLNTRDTPGSGHRCNEMCKSVFFNKLSPFLQRLLAQGCAGQPRSSRPAGGVREPALFPAAAFASSGGTGRPGPVSAPRGGGEVSLLPWRHSAARRKRRPAGRGQGSGVKGRLQVMPPGRGPGRRHPPRALPAAAALPGTGASPGTAARRRLPSGPEAAGGGGALALSGGVRAGGCNERVACSGRATSRGLSDVGLEVALELRFKPRRPKHRYPDLRSRLTASRLRPPESRSNVGCVPPTAKAAAPFSKATWAAGCCPPPASQVPSEPGESLRPPEITSDAEGDPWKLRAWIEERKQLRYQLESIVDVEKWLMGKPSLSSQEERVWERIKACRADRRAESKSALTRSLAVSACGAVPSLGSLHCISWGPATASALAGMMILGNSALGVFSTLFQCSPPASCQPWQEGRLPLIRAPYPPALVTLHNLLRKQKLTMVDVFKRAGMDRRKITRADFIHIIKARIAHTPWGKLKGKGAEKLDVT
ncbi:methyl-CpG-binding domain protein 4 isoform X1 [Ciconia boyciana]|uniref:methyl-CpG-binding domain protein 4 isoform X1 n=1 Tax=Ciconia boyciana TaxID=52775 RepID=UPI003BA12368